MKLPENKKEKEMKKVILSVLFAALIVCIFLTTASAVSLELKVELATGEELVSIENTFYLPSSADITSVKLQVSTDASSVTYGESATPLESGDTIDLTPFKTKDKYHNDCYVVEFTAGAEKQTYTFYAADSLSAVFINTSIGIDSFKIKQEKDNFTKVSILNKDGTYEYKDTEISVTESKVRGNTTPDLYKKPYQIKFDSKQDLFGLGGAKTWILLANYLDQSYLRNATMFELAQRLGMNASSFVSVDVYIDGYYEGVYLLCEKVQIQSERVDIRDLEKEMEELMGTDYGRGDMAVQNVNELINNSYLNEYRYFNDVITPEDITGGYLIELDNSNKSNRLKMDESYFITDSGNFYVIKSPEVCSREQVEYIGGLFAEMEEAFTSPTGKNAKGKHYSEYMDVDSFAYGYIMCEFGRTYDAGSNSVYFHKDADKDGVQSKFVKGPLWDCDNSLANIVRGNAHLTDNYWAANRTPWNKLTQHEDFMEVVSEKYGEIYDTIFDMIDAGGFLDKEVEKIGSSVAMDRIRNHLNTKDLWPLNTLKNFTGKHYEAKTSMIHWFNRPQISESEWAFPTYVVYTDGVDADNTTVIGNIRTHIEERANWLALQWSCGVTLRTRVDHVYDNDEDTTCNECDFVRAASAHTYENRCDADCSECGYERIPHVFDSDCDADCNECDFVREDIHLYDHGCDGDCNLCGEERDVGDHIYDNACDSNCNRCGFDRNVPGHQFSNPCDNTCNNCGLKREVEGHKGGTATCQKLAICAVCGEAYGTIASHTYGEDWVTDGSFHWKQCTQCNLAKISRSRHVNTNSYIVTEEMHYMTCTVCERNVAYSVGEHRFDSDCDDSCADCGYVRKVEHDWGEAVVTKEATAHSQGKVTYTCSKCEVEREEVIPAKASGCQSGEGALIAFLTNSGILLAWFVIKRKS